MGNSQIVKKCILYNPQTERFLLCLNEKLETAAYKKHNLLNKKKTISKPVRVRTT